MQLYEFYMRRFVADMTPGELKQILEGNHPSIWGRAQNGIIVLRSRDPDNKKIALKNRVVKCVGQYYVLGDKVSVQRNTKNFFLQCRQIQEKLGVPGYVGIGDCMECHRYCLNALEGGGLQRK
jgi:hypothetical protein